MFEAITSDPAVLDAIKDLVVALLGIVATVVLPWVGAQFVRYFGVRIEQKHMDALHMAAETWATNAVTRGVTQANDRTLAELRGYLETSVPDAMRVLGPGAKVLQALATRYLSATAG